MQVDFGDGKCLVGGLGPRGPLRVSGQKISKKFYLPLDETATRKVCWEATAKSGQLNELFDN